MCKTDIILAYAAAHPHVATSIANDATSDDNIATSASNVATSTANDATSTANDATSPLLQNKLLINKIVASKISPRMKPMQIKDLILEICIVEHSIEEIAELLHKSVTHIRNRFITEMVADGILLPTKPRHSPGQSYFTNPKYSIE